jgi:3-hydroxyacyl-[acyl-carrier-protein] dehydratase
MNRDQIQKLIPHRPPFLWLDEVVSIDEVSVHARTHVDPNLDLFRGHYPDYPVLPGVIQCEMAFQAAAVLVATLQATAAGRVPVVARLNNTKFRRMIRPGETVDIHATITDKVKSAYYLTGTVSVGTEVATRLDFTVTEAAV